MSPVAERLQSISDPYKHPILSKVHNSVPEEGAVALAGALATPLQGDEALVAIGLGLITIGAISLNRFAGKNWQPTRKRFPNELLPEYKAGGRKVSIDLHDPPQGPPWNPDPNKQPEDIPPNEIKNLKLLGKIVFYISSIAVAVKSTILGEHDPKDLNKTTPTMAPSQTPYSTPTKYTKPTITKIPKSTPTETPTVTPTPTPMPMPMGTKENADLEIIQTLKYEPY
jgi:hypothetical protein